VRFSTFNYGYWLFGAQWEGAFKDVRQLPQY